MTDKLKEAQDKCREFPISKRQGEEWKKVLKKLWEQERKRYGY